MSIVVINFKSSSGTILVKFDDSMDIIKSLKELRLEVNSIECDDTYIVQDILDEIQDYNPNVCLFLCEPNSVLYAIRAASILFKENDEIKIIIQSNNLKNGCKYGNDKFFFYATNTLDQTISEIISAPPSRQHKSIDLLKIQPKYDHAYKSVMENGYVAYMTGVYPDSSAYSSTKHIGIADCNTFYLSEDKINPSINSAIIFEDESYDKNKYFSLIETSKNLSHFHFKKDSINVVFDNSKLGTTFDCSTFKVFAEKKNNSSKTHMVSFENCEDYTYLDVELCRFFEDGIIKNPNFFLIDECKFTGNCRLKNLHRYRVVNNEICPCRSSNIKIATIGDNRLKILSNITQFSNDVQMHRHCLTCVSRDICTMCITLQDFEENEFCRIIRNHPNVAEYISKKNLYRVLREQSKLVRNAKKVIIPNKEFSVRYVGEEKGRFNDPTYYLFQIDGVEYFFDFKKAALLKIDPKLFLILEGIMRGANPENIIYSLSVACSVDNDTGKEVYDNGVTMLKKAGIIL